MVSAQIKPGEQLPELLQDWREVVALALQQDADLDPATAAKLAGLAVDALSAEFGGLQFYLPKDFAGGLRRRNEEIYELSHKQSPDQLARKYNLTRVQIFSILRRMKARDLAARNGNLFPEAPPL